MKPDFFPSLRDSDIVTIPRRIIKFPNTLPDLFPEPSRNSKASTVYKKGGCRELHVVGSVEIGYDDYIEFSTDSSKPIIPSSVDPKMTWLGVHVDCICCGCGSSSVSDDIDHQSFPSDVELQRDTNLLMVHPGLGSSDVLDDLGSSSRAWICDDTEPSPAVFSTSYGSDLDHGVLNSGGASGLLIEPNSGLAGSCLGFEGFESTFHGDVHNLDSSSIAYPFTRIGYLDSNAAIDGCSPLVLDDIEHHSLPSDVLPVDTTNGSELGLGWQDLGFSDGFDLGSSSVAHAFDNIDTDINLFPPSKKARTS
ncbi:hypothetical protein CFP56_030666 [Quercus suber]|uniref:Uncharacterized protein n=1 Tax=Quercus suber TaxID=58331 RepID=A0AAW0LTU7_QUESU